MIDRPWYPTLAIPAGMLALASCAEVPQAPNDTALEEPSPIVLAKPPSCPSQLNLTIGGLTGALTSDGGDYAEGDGVAARLSGANGNLMFNVQQSNPARTVTVATSLSSGSRSTRIFTNTHGTSCGLFDITGTGTGVLEIEWTDGGNRWTLRYGKDCSSEFGAVVAGNKIDISRVANVWTLSGGDNEGLLCRGRLTGKPNWETVGDGDAFTMTLTGP